MGSTPTRAMQSDRWRKATACALVAALSGDVPLRLVPQFIGARHVVLAATQGTSGGPPQQSNPPANVVIGQPLPPASIREADLAIEAALKAEAATISGERIGPDGAPVSEPAVLGMIFTRNLWVAMLRERAHALAAIKAKSREEKLALIQQLVNAAPALDSAYLDMVVAEGPALDPYAHEKARYDGLLRDAERYEKAGNASAAAEARDRAARSLWKFYLDRRERFFGLLEQSEVNSLLALYTDYWWGNKYLFEKLMHTQYGLDPIARQDALIADLDTYLDLNINRLGTTADEAAAITTFEEIAEFASPKYTRVHQRAMLISAITGMTLPQLLVNPLADIGKSFSLSQQFKDVAFETLVSVVCLVMMAFPVLGAFVNAGVAIIELTINGQQVVVRWMDSAAARQTGAVTGQSHVISEDEKARARAGQLIFAVVQAGTTVPFVGGVVREQRALQAEQAAREAAAAGEAAAAATKRTDFLSRNSQRGAAKAKELGVPDEQLGNYVRGAAGGSVADANSLNSVAQLDELIAAARAAGVPESQINALVNAARGSMTKLSNELPPALLKATLEKRGTKIVVDIPWKGESNMTPRNAAKPVIVDDVPLESYIALWQGARPPAGSLRMDLVAMSNLRGKLNFMQGGIPVTWSRAEIDLLTQVLGRSDLSSLYAFISDERMFMRLFDDELIGLGRSFLAAGNRDAIASGQAVMRPAVPFTPAGASAVEPLSSWIITGSAAAAALNRLANTPMRQVADASTFGQGSSDGSGFTDSGAATPAGPAGGTLTEQDLERAAVQHAREYFGRGTAEWNVTTMDNGNVVISSPDLTKAVVATVDEKNGVKSIGLERLERKGSVIIHDRRFNGMNTHWDSQIGGYDTIPGAPPGSTSGRRPMSLNDDHLGFLPGGGSTVTPAGSANIWEPKLRTTNIRTGRGTAITFIDTTNVQLWTGPNNSSAFNANFVNSASTENGTQSILGHANTQIVIARSAPSWRDLLSGPFARLGRGWTAVSAPDRGAHVSPGAASATAWPIRLSGTAAEMAAQAQGGAAVAGPGVRVFMTSLGVMTGEAFKMVVVNEGGAPAELSSEGFVLEPVARVTQAQIDRELQRLKAYRQVTTTIDGYCLEMTKLPPRMGMVFRIANQATQQKFSSARPILSAARTLMDAGKLTGGTGPAYLHAVRQWAIWALEEKLDEPGFRRAFLEHSQKNLAAAGRPWTREIETALRQLLPARWSDVKQVLGGN